MLNLYYIEVNNGRELRKCKIDRLPREIDALNKIRKRKEDKVA